jgi:hypothetical protein
MSSNHKLMNTTSAFFVQNDKSQTTEIESRTGIDELKVFKKEWFVLLGILFQLTGVNNELQCILIRCLLSAHVVKYSTPLTQFVTH